MKIFKKFSMMAMEEAAVKRAIAEVIDRRTYYGFTGHPHVSEFEQNLSRKLGGFPVLALNSGTDALVLALKVLGIGPGDEIIVPAFSFISTASCVPWVGATPVFVDIRPDDYALDPNQIEEKITPQTKAIIIAHLFGQPASGLAKVLAISKKHNLPVIEDAAQSLGAKIKIDGQWKMVGTVGDIGCLSFSSIKPFAAPGSGGAVIIRDPFLLKEADRMRLYGANVHYYDYPTVGVNCKMHDMQAAALLAKLKFLDYWFSHRHKIATEYSQKLAGLGDLVLPMELASTERTWYRYVIRTKKRDGLFRQLLKATESYYLLQPNKNYPVPLPYFAIFRKSGYKAGDFPIAGQVSREVVSLPVSNYITAAGARHVSKIVRIFFAGAMQKTQVNRI